VAKKIGEVEEATVWLDGQGKLRFEVNNNECCVYYKNSRTNDYVRKEIVVNIRREGFWNVLELLSALGYREPVMWHRRRQGCGGLREISEELGVEITPVENLDRKVEKYIEGWRKKIGAALKRLLAPLQ